MHHQSASQFPSSPTSSVARRGAGPELGTLRDFWSLFVRRWPVIAGVFLLTTVSVVAASALLPTTWTARSTIMVKQGREFFYRSEVGDPTAKPLLSVAEMVNSQVEILTSRDLSEQVISELTLERVYPDMASAAPALLAVATSRFQEGLTVMDIPESAIIRISYENLDPQVAAEAVNLLVEKFKDKHVEVFSAPALGLLGQRRQEFEQRLATSEGALEGFRQEHSIYELPEQRTLLLKRWMELESDLQTAGLRIAELEQMLAGLNGGSISAGAAEPPPAITEDRASMVLRRGKLASTLQEAEIRLAELRRQLVVYTPGGAAPGDVSGAPQLRSLDEAFIRLLDLQLREKELLRNYNDTSRLVIGVREEIAMVEAFLRDRGAYVRQVTEAAIREELDTLVARRSAALEQIESVDAQIRNVDLRVVIDELAPLQTRTAIVRQEMQRNQAQLQGLDKLELELRRLQRQVELDEANYQAFLARSEEARLMDEMDRHKLVNIAVIERAARPIEPSSLSTKLRAVIGAAVGLFAGLAVAVFLELVGKGSRAG